MMAGLSTAVAGTGSSAAAAGPIVCSAAARPCAAPCAAAARRSGFCGPPLRRAVGAGGLGVSSRTALLRPQTLDPTVARMGARGGGFSRSGARGGGRPGARDRSGPPPPRPGDWECTDCGFNNFASREECRKCNGARPEGAGGGGGGRGGFERGFDRPPREESFIAPGDWPCTRCNFLNFASRAECRECGCEKPAGGAGGAPDGFDAGPGPGSRSREPSRRERPFSNSYSSPASEGRGRPADWDCAGCGFNNFGSRFECRECGAGRPEGAAASSTGGRERRERPGPIDLGPRPGDWECSDCRYVNFGSRDECRECGHFRGENDVEIGEDGAGASTAAGPGAAAAAPYGGRGPAPRQSAPLDESRGEWECEDCAAINPADREQCRGCSCWRDGLRELVEARPGPGGGFAGGAPGGIDPAARGARPIDPAALGPPTARSVALLQLLRVEQEGAFVGLASRGAAGGSAPALDPRAARRVTDLVASVTRWRKYLDFLILKLYSGPGNPDEMELPLRMVLRLGLYELVKDGVHAHAAVNETVELAKSVTAAGAGLCNGIMRAAATALESGALPEVPVPTSSDAAEEGGDADGDDGGGRPQARALAVLHSHPTWVVRRWVGRYGRVAAEALMTHNNAPPTFGLRANAARGLDAAALAARLLELGVASTPSRFLPGEFITLRSGLQAVAGAGLLSSGACAVQDEAAGLVVALLDPQPGEHVADLCAAPGGKALFAAARMLKDQLAEQAAVAEAAAARAATNGADGADGAAAGDVPVVCEGDGCGLLVALDARAGRLAAVAAGAAALGVGAVMRTLTADACVWAREHAGEFDRVLVDAPCTGLGVLAKRADLRWRRTPADLAPLTRLQDALLDAAAKAVRPGGLLVYSTCSIEPEENEQRVLAFVQRNPEFVVESAAGVLPAEVVTPAGFYAVLPHVHGIDGAFGARLRKAASE